MSAPQVIVAATADELAHDTAERAAGRLAAAIGERDIAHLAITGGGILESVLAALATAASPPDWSKVHVWWGDERYVAEDSDDRNDKPAYAKLLDHVAVDPVKVHRMPAADAGFGDDVDAAAASYAAELAAGADEGEVPSFDVTLLGIGPDGHCCSLFPDHPGTRVLDRAVIGVPDSPKPPPVRLSLTFPTLDAADSIWFIASGAGKAEAVGRALGGADPTQVPSAGPRGRTETLWLIDADAAIQLPPAYR